MDNGFRAMTLHGWRQFENVSLDFSKRLTVLTGANGAGKTTILTLLVQHFGWSTQFVSEPDFEKKGFRFLAGIRRRWKARLRDAATGGNLQIGTLTYKDGGESQLVVPEGEVGSAVFGIGFQGQQSVFGLYVPSHRPVGVYQPVAQLPTSVMSPEQFIEQYEGEFRNRYTPGSSSAYTPAYRLKESLISLAMFGYGNEAVNRNQEFIDIYEGFQQVLRQLLPRALRFERIRVSVPEVALETGTGTFSLDAVSGGVATLIDLAWRIFMRARQNKDLVVVIDEPENHLHPELQRELLPGLMNAFPEAQFIAATHNPFIVGSVPDSNVYVLRFEEDGGVVSQLLETVNKAGSSNEILREVLGLEFTMPLWVEDRLEDIVGRYEQLPVTEESLRNLRSEMKELGMDHLFPEAVSGVLAKDDNDSDPPQS
jgi:predicted ATPase